MMKAAPFIATAMIVIGSLHGADITTLDGTTYTNIRYVQVRPDYIRIEHDDGKALIKSDNLSPRTIVTATGTEYTDAKLIGLAPDSIEISFSGGIKRLKLEALPPDLQEEFGYDPGKVKEHSKEQAARQLEWERKANERRKEEEEVNATAAARAQNSIEIANTERTKVLVKLSPVRVVRNGCIMRGTYLQKMKEASHLPKYVPFKEYIFLAGHMGGRILGGSV